MINFEYILQNIILVVKPRHLLLSSESKMIFENGNINLP